MRTAQLGGVVDTAACGETWDQWLTEKLSRTASPVCGKTKHSCSETGTGLDTSRESRGPCFTASQITARLSGPSHYDKPLGPLATHHLHNNSASSPCRRGSTINIHQGLKNNNKNNNCRGLLTALLYWHLQTSQDASRSRGLSHPHRLTKPRRLLTFRSDKSGSTGGTYAPEQLKLNQALSNIFLPVE